MGMAEHREPYDARVSRTVLGARGGETPPRDSPSVPDDRRPEALALAGRRPGWGRARRSRPEAAGQAGRQAYAPEAAEAADAAPACPDHGQAAELRRRERRGDALGRASKAQRFKQQGGEFASADATARTADEAVQVSWPGPALPLRSRSDQQLVPPPPRSPPRPSVSSRPNPGLPDLGRGHRRGRSGIGLRGTGLRGPCRDQSRSS